MTDGPIRVAIIVMERKRERGHGEEERGERERGTSEKVYFFLDTFLMERESV